MPVAAIEGLVPYRQEIAAAVAAYPYPSETRPATFVGVRRTPAGARRQSAQDWQGYIWR